MRALFRGFVWIKVRNILFCAQKRGNLMLLRVYKGAGI